MIPGISVTRLRCANTAERIEVLLEVETLENPRTQGFDAAYAKLLWSLVNLSTILQINTDKTLVT